MENFYFYFKLPIFYQVIFGYFIKGPILFLPCGQIYASAQLIRNRKKLEKSNNFFPYATQGFILIFINNTINHTKISKLSSF
jgi:hypothetical protein